MHPWIFSGAIAHVAADPEPGETVEVISHAGDWLCRGAYSPHSNIRIRIWTWDKAEEIDAIFLERRIQTAVRLRNSLDFGNTDMLRLVNAESDGLPGLIVDRYRDVLVVQLLSAGTERLKTEITHVLSMLPGISCIYERSDLDVRKLEGLAERQGILSGQLPVQPFICHENDLKFQIDIVHGHKTGFYLDQRANRRLLQCFSDHQSVLNCFSYTGAFSVYGLAGGAAHVTSVESSADALRMGEINLDLNRLDRSKHLAIEGDVFKVLRKFRDEGRSFDVIVLDPPKFAPTASQAQRASRGYKDINLLAFKLLRPGGYLMTFSCSGGVTMELFQKIVASAALDAGVQALVIRQVFQDFDHPFRLNFQEGIYLKGLVCTLPG